MYYHTAAAAAQAPSIMDLTPKTSTPWWSLLTCCKNDGSADDSATDDNGEEYPENINIPTTITKPTPSLSVVTHGKLVIVEATDENRLATPATACSDVSNDSFFADNFIGEVTVSTPKSKAGASSDMGCSTVSPTSALYATLSPDKLASLIEEKEMENIDKVKDDITDDGELSDPDDENYWYNSLLPMKKKKSTKEKGESKTTNQTEKNDDIVITAKSILCGTMSDDTTDDDEVPEIDSQSSSDMSSSDNSSPTVQQQQNEPIQYQQFMSLLLLRHMFGSWYLRSNTTTGATETESMSSYESGDLGDIGAQCTDVSSEEENEEEEEEERSEYDNETSETEEEKKDVRYVPRGKMRLRTLKYEDSTVEVFPQLKTEGNEEDDLVLFGPVI